jgi:hypothetical protein
MIDAATLGYDYLLSEGANSPAHKTDPAWKRLFMESGSWS